MFGFSPTFFRMGLNLGLVSYMGRFRIAMTTDDNSGFKLGVFKNFLEEELDAALNMGKHT